MKTLVACFRALGTTAAMAKRLAVRLGAETVHVFTRKRDDYTALESEMQSAMQEGVCFRTLLSFLNIETDRETGAVCAVWLQPEIVSTYDEFGFVNTEHSSNYPYRFKCDLLIMAVGVGIGLFTQNGWMPEITNHPFTSHHPKGLPIFPFLCITIACGAISGFHATQSPLMSRCIQNERRGRLVFYGAMITEGIVAMIWAAAAIKFAAGAAVPNLSAEIVAGGQHGAPGPLREPFHALNALLNAGGGTNPAFLVNLICKTWMGRIGALLAVLGVVAAPITSGDTAYRSARLIVADFLHLNQKKIANRLLLALPLFAISAALVFVDFDILWRYFAWTNQTLATCFLWTAAVWLHRHGRNAWIAFLPAVFMTVVVTSYILAAPEGFSLPHTPSLIAGFALAICLAIWFLRFRRTFKKEPLSQLPPKGEESPAS